MKIKTSELFGIALDWIVAELEGFALTSTCLYNNVTLWKDKCRYSPSSDWSQGGPIIERERVDLFIVHYGEMRWTANDSRSLAMEDADTPLVAAMRCYVASKLGEEVDIPDAILGVGNME